MNDVFSIKEFNFPNGFLWGSSTAGHQIEGDNIYSDRYAREIELAKTNPKFVPSGKACNSYELYKTDIDLLKKLNHGAYRMSIEWSSFLPRFGLVDVKRDEDFLREIKPSGYFYSEIIKNNGFKPQMLKKYLKSIPRVKYDVKQV